MPNEATKLSQSDPETGRSPEPYDEEPAGGEFLVPMLLIITFSLFMLMIFAFTHTADLTSFRMARGEDASARAAGNLFGNLIGWFLLPLIIGWLASRTAKPPRRMKRLAIGFVSIGILESISSLAAYNPQRTFRSPGDPQQEIVGIVKQASGAQPANGASTAVLGKDLSPVVRDFFSQVMRLRRKHDQDSEQYARALGKLYSPDSFSSPARMRESMQAVDGIQKLDQDFANSFGKSLGDLKTSVQASSLSASDKEEFLRGVNNGLGSSDVVTTWKDLQKAEDQWSRATHAFYGFALTQSSAIKVENGRVLIVGEAVRQEFNSRLHECAGLSNRVMAASRAMALKQQAGMRNMGVTKSDLGLQK